MDFAEFQVKRYHLAAAWEAVGREVVEVVAAQVKQLRLGGEASWDFGVTSTLTCSMLGFNLGGSNQNGTSLTHSKICIKMYLSKGLKIISKIY